jgi:MFS superfamily sulfate permease-like transporter
LSAAAIDKLDPLKRQSDLDRDLWAKGVCNFICGLIGGLPIIAEIVRSSANISSGAKSKNSNFFHGCFILAFSFFFHGFLMKFQCQHYPHF